MVVDVSLFRTDAAQGVAHESSCLCPLHVLRSRRLFTGLLATAAMPVWAQQSAAAAADEGVKRDVGKDQPLRYADYGYIMESGRVVMDGQAADLRDNEDVKEFYLGMGGGERKSFKDVKSYKRRKRWLA